MVKDQKRTGNQLAGHLSCLEEDAMRKLRDDLDIANTFQMGVIGRITRLDIIVYRLCQLFDK